MVYGASKFWWIASFVSSAVLLIMGVEASYDTESQLAAVFVLIMNVWLVTRILLACAGMASKSPLVMVMRPSPALNAAIFSELKPSLGALGSPRQAEDDSHVST